jgi:hypothetical protein
MLARVQQFPRPSGHADDVLLDALEHAAGQTTSCAVTAGLGRNETRPLP